MTPGQKVGLGFGAGAATLLVIGLVVESRGGTPPWHPPPGYGPCGASCCPSGFVFSGCNGNAPTCSDLHGNTITEPPGSCLGNCGVGCCPTGEVFVGCVSNSPVCARPTDPNYQYPCPCGCTTSNLGACQGYTPIQGFQGCCPPGNPNCWQLFPPGGCPSPTPGQNCDQYCIAHGSQSYACCDGVCNCTGHCPAAVQPTMSAVGIL